MTPTPILLNDFRRIPPHIKEQLTRAASDVVASGWYVLGPNVRTFEEAWSSFCGVRCAIGVGNGMDAIEIGLRACGIGPGAEVITTPFTAFATVLGIIRAGATPVLADIDPSTGLLDPLSVERCIGPRTRAVLIVHLYGQLRNPRAWKELCAKHRILLLEDCAQAHGAEMEGGKAGSFGSWGAFSFYPTKNLGAFGDGGALCTSDATIAEKAVSLRNYGQADRYHHPLIGLNSRLDELQAACLEIMLGELVPATDRRRAIARRYHAGIRSGRVRLLAAPTVDSSHVYHLFVLRCQERQRLQKHLEVHGVQTLIHYPVCVHQQPPCGALARDPHGLPEAEAIARECLSIPCHPYLTDCEVDRVISAINSF